MDNEANACGVDEAAKAAKKRYLDQDFEFLSHNYYNLTTAS